MCATLPFSESSPSRAAVCRKAFPVRSSVHMSTQSAGMVSPSLSSRISPTLMSCIWTVSVVTQSWYRGSKTLSRSFSLFVKTCGSTLLRRLASSSYCASVSPVVRSCAIVTRLYSCMLTYLSARWYLSSMMNSRSMPKNIRKPTGITVKRGSLTVEITSMYCMQLVIMKSCIATLRSTINIAQGTKVGQVKRVVFRLFVGVPST